MDSTSGSLQSSSGDDQEYDSRTKSISAFLNHHSSSHVGPIHPNPPPQQPPPHHHHHHLNPQTPTSLFDPLSTLFDRSSSDPNPLLNNLDMVWPKPPRSDPNCTDLANILSPNNFPPSSQGQNRPNFPTPSPPLQFPPVPENAVVSSSDHQTSTTTTTNTTVTARNSKKRSRASRRAPTTVLTTDTTNFRAMVQEFTGIPAPPFTSSSPFPIRNRFDLFGTTPPSSSMRYSTSTHLDPPLPPYLLRPFPQKFQLPPFLNSSSSSTTTTTTASNNTSNSNFISNYQLPSSDLLNNIHNPILSFQSLLQTPPPKYPLPNSAAIIGAKPQTPCLQISAGDNSHLKMGVLDEFGLSHGHVDAPPNWADSNHDSADQGGLLRSINGDYSNNDPHRVITTNGKLNYSASSSSDFHGEHKAAAAAATAAENVSTRSEGMVESWICSSD